MAQRKEQLNQEKLIDIKKILAIIKKNFTVIMRDKARLLPLLMFPVFMIMIFGFTSGNTPKHLPAAIIVYDDSQLSHQIQQELYNAQLLSIRKQLSTEDEGKKLLDKGEIKVLIIIPANLQETIDRGDQAHVIVTVDESESSVASAAKDAINRILQHVSSELSVEHIMQYQTQVGAASYQLQQYATQQGAQPSAQLDAMIRKTQGADAALDKARKGVQQQADALERAIIPPSQVLDASHDTAYALNTSANSSANTYHPETPETPEYVAAKAQVTNLRNSVVLIKNAQQNIKDAGSIVQQEKQIEAARKDDTYYSHAVLEPGQAITEFSDADASTLAQPLVMEEKAAYGTGKRAIDFTIPAIIALTIFQGAVMGMGRAVAGERRNGSLTRVFLTPTSNTTIVLGTLLFYIVFEVFRSSFLILLAMSLFSIKIEGSLLSIFIILVLYAGVSTAIGMFISTLVKTEDQYMGMAMLVSMPTIFLGGAFFPIQTMPKFLQGLASVLPVTYAGDALRGVMIKGFSLATVSLDLLILGIFFAATVGAVLMVFKREVVV